MASSTSVVFSELPRGLSEALHDEILFLLELPHQDQREAAIIDGFAPGLLKRYSRKIDGVITLLNDVTLATRMGFKFVVDKAAATCSTQSHRYYAAPARLRPTA